MSSVATSEHEVLFDPLKHYSRRFYVLVAALLAIVAWGLYAYSTQLVYGLGVTGMRNIVSWGFYIILFVFFIGISHVGALVSAILRVTNAEWRLPITRMSETVTFASLIVALAMPLVDMGRPERILNLLLYGRIQSPIVWDFICIGTYFISSTVYLYLPLVPDIAACRDKLQNVSTLRKKFYDILSLGYTGVGRQKELLEKAIQRMALLIIPMVIMVHTIVSWDFAMTLRSGWNETIFGPYFVVGALVSGVATVLMIMVVLVKTHPGFAAYLTPRHFNNMTKLLLAIDIVLIYFIINEFLVVGYKHFQQETLEGLWLSSLFWGQFSPFFWAWVGLLVAGAAILGYPKTRRSFWGIFTASLFIVIALWLERFIVVVPSLALPQFPYSWGIYYPTWVEISIAAAGFAGFALIYAVFTRLFPIIPVWEHQELSHAPSQPSPPPAAGTFAGPGHNLGAATAGIEVVSNPRRDFLRFAVLGISGPLLGFPPLKAAARVDMTMLPGKQETGQTHEMPLSKLPRNSETTNRIPLSSLGKSVTLSEARRLLQTPIAHPTQLPEGTTVRDILVTENGGRVVIAYSNPTVPIIPLYEESVAIILTAVKESVVNSSPAYAPEYFKHLSIGGFPGIAREPAKGRDKDRAQPAMVQWWQRGMHYSILANVPLTRLVLIAESLAEVV